jgi:hypothetical protein
MLSPYNTWYNIIVMKKSLGLSIVIALVFAGTLFVLFAQEPEQRVVYSEDGQARFEYVAENGRYLQIHSEPPFDPPLERGENLTEYWIEPADYVLVQTATLVISYLDLDSEIAPEQLFIAEFDSETGEWQIVPTKLDREQQELSIEIEQLGRWKMIDLEI